MKQHMIVVVDSWTEISQDIERMFPILYQGRKWNMAPWSICRGPSVQSFHAAQRFWIPLVGNSSHMSSDSRFSKTINQSALKELKHSHNLEINYWCPFLFSYISVISCNRYYQSVFLHHFCSFVSLFNYSFIFKNPCCVSQIYYDSLLNYLPPFSPSCIILSFLLLPFLRFNIFFFFSYVFAHKTISSSVNPLIPSSLPQVSSPVTQ